MSPDDRVCNESEIEPGPFLPFFNESEIEPGPFLLLFAFCFFVCMRCVTVCMLCVTNDFDADEFPEIEKFAFSTHIGCATDWPAWVSPGQRSEADAIGACS